MTIIEQARQLLESAENDQASAAELSEAARKLASAREAKRTQVREFERVRRRLRLELSPAEFKAREEQVELARIEADRLEQVLQMVVRATDRAEREEQIRSAPDALAELEPALARYLAARDVLEEATSGLRTAVWRVEKVWATAAKAGRLAELPEPDDALEARIRDVAEVEGWPSDFRLPRHRPPPVPDRVIRVGEPPAAEIKIDLDAPRRRGRRVISPGIGKDGNHA